MSYVERVLQPGETLLCRSRLHWLIYLPVLPFLAIFVLGAVLYLGMPSSDANPLALALMAVGAIGAIVALAQGLDPARQHRARGHRSPRHLQARPRPSAHRRDEHGQGRERRRRPVGAGPHLQLRRRHRARHRREHRALATDRKSPGIPQLRDRALIPRAGARLYLYRLARFGYNSGTRHRPEPVLSP